MRFSDPLIQNPPLFRVVHNYAMLSRLGLKGGGPGSQKLKQVLNKKLRVFWCPALFEFPVKFHYETGPRTIFQGSSPRAALIRFSKLFRWSALMRSPGDRGATKPGKLRPSSFKASPQPSTPSRPTPSPRPSPSHTLLRIPENPKIVWGRGGGGVGGLNRVYLEAESRVLVW